MRRLVASLAATVLATGMSACGESGQDEDSTVLDAVGSNQADAHWSVPSHCTDPDLPFDSDPTTLTAALEAFRPVVFVARGRPISEILPTDLGGTIGAYFLGTYAIDTVLYSDAEWAKRVELPLLAKDAQIEAVTLADPLGQPQHVTYFEEQPSNDYLLLIGSAGAGNYRIFGAGTERGLVPSAVCSTGVPALVEAVGAGLGTSQDETIIELVEYVVARYQDRPIDPVVDRIVRTTVGAPAAVEPPTLEDAWASTPVEERSLDFGDIPPSEADSVSVIGASYDVSGLSESLMFDIRCDLGVSVRGAGDAFPVGLGEAIVTCSSGEIGLHVGEMDVDPVEWPRIASVNVSDLTESAASFQLMTAEDGNTVGNIEPLTAVEWTARTGIEDLAGLITGMSGGLLGS